MDDCREIINLIRSEYQRLDAVTGVDTSKIEIRLSGRMIRRLGCFCAGKKMSITISKAIVPDRMDDFNKAVVPMHSDLQAKNLSKTGIDKQLELFLDVIRHEYAHAVVYLRYPRQRHAHDKVWKDVCIEVGCQPRATVKSKDFERATANASDFAKANGNENIFENLNGNESTFKKISDQSKYIIRCQSCGAESSYKIKSTIVKIVLGEKRGRIHCRKCNGRSFTLRTFL